MALESLQLDEAREDAQAGRVVADDDADDLLDRLVHGELSELPHEALRDAIRAGLDSGPGLPAEEVFAELRGRYAAEA